MVSARAESPRPRVTSQLTIGSEQARLGDGGCRMASRQLSHSLDSGYPVSLRSTDDVSASHNRKPTRSLGRKPTSARESVASAAAGLAPLLLLRIDYLFPPSSSSTDARLFHGTTCFTVRSPLLLLYSQPRETALADPCDSPHTLLSKRKRFYRIGGELGA